MEKSEERESLENRKREELSWIWIFVSKIKEKVPKLSKREGENRVRVRGLILDVHLSERERRETRKMKLIEIGGRETERERAKQ